MSLRKSPTTTPAFLAANRANAQKCTGPRTPEGRTRVALNALHHGLKARSFLSHLTKSRRARQEFKGHYRALYAALLPNETGIHLLKRTVLRVWAMKQEAMRRALHLLNGLPWKRRRAALQFEAIMSLKRSHLRFPGRKSHYVIENKRDARCEATGVQTAMELVLPGRSLVVDLDQTCD